jgi:hypothetical protein
MKDLISMSLQGSPTEDLRELHDRIASRIRSLEALKFDFSERNVNLILFPILEMKLRSDLLEEWEREISDVEESKLTVELYFKFIEKRTTAKEAMERSSPEDRFNQFNSVTEPVCSSAALVTCSDRTFVTPHSSSGHPGDSTLVSSNGRYQLNDNAASEYNCNQFRHIIIDHPHIIINNDNSVHFVMRITMSLIAVRWRTSRLTKSGGGHRTQNYAFIYASTAFLAIFILLLPVGNLVAQ